MNENEYINKLIEQYYYFQSYISQIEERAMKCDVVLIIFISVVSTTYTLSQKLSHQYFTISCIVFPYIVASCFVFYLSFSREVSVLGGMQSALENVINNNIGKNIFNWNSSIVWKHFLKDSFFNKILHLIYKGLLNVVAIVMGVYNAWKFLDIWPRVKIFIFSLYCATLIIVYAALIIEFLSLSKLASNSYNETFKLLLEKKIQIKTNNTLSK